MAYNNSLSVNGANMIGCQNTSQRKFASSGALLTLSHDDCHNSHYISPSFTATSLQDVNLSISSTQSLDLSPCQSGEAVSAEHGAQDRCQEVTSMQTVSPLTSRPKGATRLSRQKVIVGRKGACRFISKGGNNNNAVRCCGADELIPITMANEQCAFDGCKEYTEPTVFDTISLSYPLCEELSNSVKNDYLDGINLVDKERCCEKCEDIDSRDSSSPSNASCMHGNDDEIFYDLPWDSNRDLHDRLHSLLVSENEAILQAPDVGEENNYQHPWDSVSQQQCLEEKFCHLRKLSHVSDVCECDKQLRHMRLCESNTHDSCLGEQPDLNISTPDIYHEPWDAKKGFCDMINSSPVSNCHMQQHPLIMSDFEEQEVFVSEAVPHVLSHHEWEEVLVSEATSDSTKTHSPFSTSELF